MFPTSCPLHRLVLLSLAVLMWCAGPGSAWAQETDPPSDPPPTPPPVIKPEISFDAEAVVADGLTPEGHAVMFGIARRWLGYHQRVERFEEVLTADADGATRLELGEDVPPFAMWVVVDLQSGEAATGPTPGFSGTVHPFPSAGLHGRGGEPDRLRQALESGQILYVRPGVGAWGLTPFDGGGFDADGTDDGAFEVALGDLLPTRGSDQLPAAEPPTAIAPGDLIYVVDPRDVTLYSIRVTPDVLH